LLVAASALTACAQSLLPTPRLGDHVKAKDVPVVVPYPPPPARVDIVPKEPPNSVWVDGQWEWQARRWVWRPGAWEIAPPHACYAPPLTNRSSDGTLWWYEGRWHSEESCVK
jgi:hypothetical protein